RTNYFTLRQSVPVERHLRDYETFTWQDVTLEICPAPGHTRGQVALVWDRGGQRVAFVGDLIRDDGQVETIYDLQVNYGGWEGMQETLNAMAYLRTFGPSVLFPSHGGAVGQPEAAMDRLAAAMQGWLTFYGNTVPTPQPDTTRAHLKPVIPDVYFSEYTNANHYIVLSRTGKALFVDYGPNYGIGLMPVQTHADESNRFTPHSLAELRAMGMTTVDVAMPSHLHDDHTTGFHYLVRKEGTRIWCYENMVSLLEHPTSEVVGCTLPVPVPVDRAIADGEEVEWEEFRLQVRYSPGHAQHHNTILLEHEGRRVAFTGDNIFNFANQRDGQGRRVLTYNLIPLNRNRPDDHLKTAEILLDFEPEVICPGHGGPYDVTREDLLGYRDTVAQIPAKFQALVGGRDVNRAMDYYWARVYPYEQPVEPQRPFTVTVRLRHYEATPATGTLTAALPQGWCAAAPVQRVHLHPGGETEVEFALVPGERRPGAPAKVPFAFALELNGRPLGEVCHGIGNYLRYPYHGG
ncbi:MAG: MBL fold metallo-hydrolase, partial [Candidatus Latescibacterota bacterium]